MALILYDQMTLDYHENLTKYKLPFQALLGSTCNIKPEDVSHLRTLIKDKYICVTLLYRGSLHGWTI